MADISAIAAEWQLGSAATALAVSRDDVWLAVGNAEGAVCLLNIRSGSPDMVVVKAFDGAVLTLAPGLDDETFIAGGEDGTVQIIHPNEGARVLATHKGVWIEHVAAVPGLEQYLYAERKNLHRLNADGAPFGEPIAHPSTVAGIAVDSKQRRVACPHYNGVTLTWLKPEKTTSEVLEWKGSHTGALWHPKEQIVVTTMQEPALHGWRIMDKAEMRMSGYVAKVESIAFMEGGKYLASAGADGVICWPFFGGGPWGKDPLNVGPDAGALVTKLAAHGKDPLIAAAYAHGGIALIPLFEGGALQLLKPNDIQITAMGWTDAGDALFVGDENGTLYLFTIESVSRAFAPAS